MQLDTQRVATSRCCHIKAHVCQVYHGLWSTAESDLTRASPSTRRAAEVLDVSDGRLVFVLAATLQAACQSTEKLLVEATKDWSQQQAACCLNGSAPAPGPAVKAPRSSTALLFYPQPRPTGCHARRCSTTPRGISLLACSDHHRGSRRARGRRACLPARQQRSGPAVRNLFEIPA